MKWVDLDELTGMLKSKRERERANESLDTKATGAR
jgi:hypothetical protein